MKNVTFRGEVELIQETDWNLLSLGNLMALSRDFCPRGWILINTFPFPFWGDDEVTRAKQLLFSSSSFNFPQWCLSGSAFLNLLPLSLIHLFLSPFKCQAKCWFKHRRAICLEMNLEDLSVGELFVILKWGNCFQSYWFCSTEIEGLPVFSRRL